MIQRIYQFGDVLAIKQKDSHFSWAEDEWIGVVVKVPIHGSSNRNMTVEYWVIGVGAYDRNYNASEPLSITMQRRPLQKLQEYNTVYPGEVYAKVGQMTIEEMLTHSNRIVREATDYHIRRMELWEKHLAKKKQ